VKDFFKIGLAVLFSAYMFMLSCGFTISHVYCSKGEQWVGGSEMPPKKHVSKTNKYLYSSEKCHESDQKDDDQRRKDTFDLKFKFKGTNILSQKVEFISFYYKIVSKIINTFLNSSIKKELLRNHSLPDLSSPDLIELQVFRI